MSKLPATKIKITEQVSTIQPYEFEGTINSIIAALTELAKEHGGECELDWQPEFHYDYDSHPSSRFALTKQRPETDEEFTLRTKTQAEDAARKEEYELAELARLQAKFRAKFKES